MRPEFVQKLRVDLVLVLMAIAGAIAAFLLRTQVPLIALVGIVVVAAGAAWIFWTVRAPLWPFLVQYFVLVGVYYRLAIPLGAGAQGGGATLALGDLLWLATLAGLLLRGFPHGIPWPTAGRFPPRYWTMVPYVVLSVALPVLGVVIYRAPPTYAISGLRTLQWASLAPMTAYLCVRYGTERITRAVFLTMALAGAAHCVYGLVQFSFGMGWLGGFWILPDIWLANLQGMVRFYYPRATGLLINPNALGVYSAFLAALFLGFQPHGFRLFSARAMTAVAVMAGLGIVLSGSRTALLSVMMLLGMLVLLSGLTKRMAAGGVVAVLMVVIGALLVLPLLQGFLPEFMAERFAKLLEVFREGAGADPTANARVLEWDRLWQIYWNDYPQGTWLPPSYALQSPIDSYYMLTLVQGSIFYTLAWLLFMVGLAGQGLAVFAQRANGNLRGTGLVLYLVVGVLLGAGLGMSAMPKTQFIGPLWVLVGVCYMMTVGRRD